jgi:hypothetical protein
MKHRRDDCSWSRLNSTRRVGATTTWATWNGLRCATAGTKAEAVNWSVYASERVPLLFAAKWPAQSSTTKNSTAQISPHRAKMLFSLKNTTAASRARLSSLAG